MKKLFTEHAVKVPACDISGRIPKLKEWNSFSHPKKDYRLQAYHNSTASMLNEKEEKGF